MKKYSSLLRVNQYVKNTFILLPAFFALKFFNIDILSNLIIVFIGFSLSASAIYILNDLKDIEQDKLHPKKKSRPLASGVVRKNIAIIFMLVCITFGGVLIAFISIKAFICMVVYIIINILYTFKLKNIAIIDIMIIASGFVIRIFVGGYATNTQLSNWIVLVTFLLSLFLALAKRRDDCLIYLKTGEVMRKNITGYNIEFINISMAIMSSVVVFSYIMYTMSSEVINRFNTDKIYITVFSVILGMLRYLQIAFVEEKSGSPTEILFRDRIIQLSLISWIVLLYILIYNTSLKAKFSIIFNSVIN